MTTLTETEAAMANKILAVAMVGALSIAVAVFALCVELGQPFMDQIFSIWTR